MTLFARGAIVRAVTHRSRRGTHTTSVAATALAALVASSSCGSSSSSSGSGGVSVTSGGASSGGGAIATGGVAGAGGTSGAAGRASGGASSGGASGAAGGSDGSAASGGSATADASADAGAFDAGARAGGDYAASAGDAATQTGREGGALGAVDPGTGPWVPVPDDQVADVCRLDPAALAQADATLNTPWAIVRYGRLCHEFESATMTPAEAWSTTKTLGAVVAGAVSYQTKHIAKTGPKTGPFTDQDRVDQWLDGFTYNKDAHVAHVLAMVAQNASLALGQKTMSYDTIGTVQINSLSDILNAAIRQDSARLGASLEDFTQQQVFGPLGMHDSTWSNGAPDKIFAFSWVTTVRDMARIGLLMMNHGVWSGRRILDEEWIYRMTHPSFEDANTGYGYLTWLNASSNFTFGGIPGAPVGLQQTAQSPGPCAPVSIYDVHPHGLSDSPDCNYAAPYTCKQQYDVGVWQAVGLQGQVIQGHPGLDLVIVVRDLTPLDTGPSAPGILWNAVRPAVIAADPKFKGDEASFCAAYGGNAYAPDLR